MVNGRFIVPQTAPISNTAYTVRGNSVIKGYVISNDDQFSPDGKVVYTVNVVNVVKATSQSTLSGSTLTAGTVTYTLNSTHALEFNLDPIGTDCGQFLLAACFSDPLGYYAYPWPAFPSYPNDTASISVDETCSARSGSCTPQNIPSEEEISFGVFIDAPEYWYLAQTSAAYSCNLPTQEATAFDGWDAADSEPSIGLWKQTVSDPSGDNFFGFQVQEADAGGGVDACWFPNPDGVVPTTTVTGGAWMVQDGNTWGDDHVGSLPSTVAYYRAHERVPCTITVHQQMQMRCSDDAWHNYGPVNTLQSIITATTVTSVRAGGTATRRY
jgi:hypothetical protein